MKFTKMHGLGNDYIYVNCFEQKIKDPAELAPIMSKRHFGIGGDGLILIEPSKKADVRMRIFNADGMRRQVRLRAQARRSPQVAQSARTVPLPRIAQN
jgi:diaminopimelate epimerase